MNLIFEPGCWSDENADRRRALVDLLILVHKRPVHSVQADRETLVRWCKVQLPTHVEVLEARLGAAWPRAGAVDLHICPDGADQITGEPPWTLTASAAFRVLEEPLVLVLENQEADRIFLEALLPDLRSWRDTHGVRIEHGGGSDMLRRIEEVSAHPTRRWRTFFVFDSDRLHPEELCEDWEGPQPPDVCMGWNLERACREIRAARWRRLNRRSIENYLPREPLERRMPHVAGVLFGPQVGKLAHFYNMKRGLRGDGVHPPDPGRPQRAARSRGCWSALSQEDRDALNNGFGDKVAVAFNELPVDQRWPEDVLAEIAALSDQLQDAI